MIERFEQTFMSIRSMKKIFFVPFFVFYALIPYAIWIAEQSILVVEDRLTLLTGLCGEIAPIFSVWWLYLVLKEYIEGDGHELLQLHGNVRFISVVLYFLSVISYLPVFLCEGDSTELCQLFFQLCCITFFMYGLVLAVISVIKNVSFGILIMLLYHVFANNPLEGEFMATFRYGSWIGYIGWDEHMPLYLGSALVLWVISFVNIGQFGKGGGVADCCKNI